jgi:ribonucleoside-diphosphate reductase beta chain
MSRRSLVEKYKEPVEFAEKQLSVFWLPEEIKVEKDVQDILVNFTEAEKHAVITTLKLFTKYEDFAGEEYWGGRYKRIFDGTEFRRMASVFSMFETAVHLPFYRKINELLNLNTDDFYEDYVNNPVLKSRMEFVDTSVEGEDDLESLAVFSMVEGAVLYSAFAFLKHFQANGKNKLLNIVRGINFSVRDENLHSIGGAWSFKHLKEQRQLSEEQEEILHTKIVKAAHTLLEHESGIIDMLFEKGNIEGITPIQLKHFVESRLNQCLHELGYKKEFDVKYNPIADWFYKNITSFTFNDFFTGQGNQYHRNWDSTSFVWKKTESENE